MTDFDFSIVCTLNHDVMLCFSMWSEKEVSLSWENVLMAWEMVVIGTFVKFGLLQEEVIYYESNMEWGVYEVRPIFTEHGTTWGG